MESNDLILYVKGLGEGQQSLSLQSKPMIADLLVAWSACLPTTNALLSNRELGSFRLAWESPGSDRMSSHWEFFFSLKLSVPCSQPFNFRLSL